MPMKIKKNSDENLQFSQNPNLKKELPLQAWAWTGYILNIIYNLKYDGSIESLI